MRAFGTMVAWPGELMLSLEENDSPRRAVSFSPKQFGGPGEPEASQGPENFLK